jgi:hypothetical protein
MSRRVIAHLLGVALVLSLTGSAVAAKGHKGGPHGQGKKHGAEVVTHAAKPHVEVVQIDRDGHRRMVTQYYRREALPPGLAKRDRLPPGLEKQLRERGHLPPGLQKRLTPVPAPLVNQLPAVPPYYTRYFIGRDLVIVDQRTNRITAVIRNVLPS